MGQIKKSRLFGFFSLVACIVAVTGSHYYRILFPVGIVVWFGLATATLYCYLKGM
jgi:hypothetical protein